jgi:hypothetical protein
MTSRLYWIEGLDGYNKQNIMTSRLYWIEGLDGYDKQTGKTLGLEQVMKRKK